MSAKPNIFRASSPLFPLDFRVMKHLKKNSESKHIKSAHFTVKYTTHSREISTYFSKDFISYKNEEI